MNLSSIKVYFSRAIALYKVRWKVLWGTAFIGGVVMMVPMAAGTMGFFAAAAAGKAPAGMVSLLLGALGAVWAFSWAEAAFCVALSVPEAGIKASFANARPRVMPLMKVNVILCLAVFGGMTLFILPGVLFSVWFIFAPCAVLFENLRGVDALLASRHYVKGKFWAVFFRLLAAWFFLTLIQIIPVVGQIAAIVLSPIPFIITILIYQDLKKDAPTFQPGAGGKGMVVAAAVLGLAVPAAGFFFAAKNAEPGGAPTASSTPPAGGAISIPAVPANGILRGKPFKLDSAKMDMKMGILDLRQGKGPSPDKEVKILLFKEGIKPQGRTYEITPEKAEFAVQIQLGWKEPGAENMSRETHAKGFTMHLEFGKEKDGKLPGKVFIEITRKGRSRIAGTFLADITRRMAEKKKPVEVKPVEAGRTVGGGKELPKVSAKPKNDLAPEDVDAEKEKKAEARRLKAQARKRAREERRENLEGTALACANEIGLFCNSVKGSIWKSLACIRRRKDALLPACLKKLRALDRK